ncbi:MAG TPA: SCO family protein [Candidatus Acidoferrales bacterium]|jgi:protein SCO1/2|nr:SCO family protein [Candidatus Acidoferrales bacterium]
MADISRRRLLSWTAMAPVAVATGVALGGVSSVAGGSGRLTQSELARRRIQRLHLPNVPLLTHEGKQVMFYDDLIKNKAVSLNFFFAKCDEICPRVTANLAKVQELLGADLGTKIFMYSFTLKPEEDDPEAIRRYRQMFNAKPGWTFLTGKPEDMEKIRRGIGFSYPDPAIDKDKTQHIGNVRYGNEPLMLWGACPGMAHARFVAESISWMIHLDAAGPGIKRQA